jgi:hypothetical protein
VVDVEVAFSSLQEDDPNEVTMAYLRRSAYRIYHCYRREKQLEKS